MTAVNLQMQSRKQATGVDVMAKVVEFYLRGAVPKKVKPVAIEQRGKLVEFPKENFAAQSKTKDNTEHGEGSASTVLFFGCF